MGHHEGGFTPFDFRVDQMIRSEEKNTLTVRVLGPIMLTDKIVDGIGKMETPQWRGGLSAGIWQGVQLIATGDSYVNDVFITSNGDSAEIDFQVTLAHMAKLISETEIEIKIIDREKKITQVNKKAILKPGINTYETTVKIDAVKLWSPDDPHLYNIELTIKENNIISDKWAGRHGFRSFTIKDKKFHLNGEEIYLKATFFEGLYPNNIAYPDSEEMIRREIQLAKDAGFNMIRPWRRPPAPIWLDIADEMGILVVGSPALECMTLPLSTPYLPTRVENEVRQTILRDRNRTCIVQWELFNELHRPVLKQLMHPMAMITRDLDPTRLILDESGGWAFGANIYLPENRVPTKFNDIHNYAGPLINRMRYEGYLSIGLTDEEINIHGYKGNKVGRNVVPGLMSFVSEMGYGSLPDLTEANTLFKEKGNPLTPAYRYHHRIHEEQQNVLKESGFDSMYPSMKSFYLDQQKIHGSANKRMIEAVRANPAVSGYCIHALAAGDWILGAGLIDIWRRPKTDAYYETKEANQKQIASIRVVPRNIYSEMGAKLKIFGINDLQKSPATLTVEIFNEKNKRVFTKTKNIQWEHGPTLLLDETLNSEKWHGEYTVEVRIAGTDRNILTRNNYAFNVFQEKQLRLSKSNKVSLLTKNPPLQKFLNHHGITPINFGADLNQFIPVIVTDYSTDAASSRETFSDLFDFVQKGGTAVYFRSHEGSGKISPDNASFPFVAKIHPARGLWTCIPHLVKNHPIFDGLPTDTMMRDIYENVWPTTTLRDIKLHSGESISKPIVGSIGFDWFSRDHKLQYSGPGASWWGSDLVIFRYGKGHIIVSQLRLLENLNKDPVADKITSNLIRFLNKGYL